MNIPAMFTMEKCSRFPCKDCVKSLRMPKQQLNKVDSPAYKIT